MTKYQLLRSNKQSGPFTREELQVMGLKPFDLIWVEGKSFSWRYPSEVDELKDIAPSIEAPITTTVNTIAAAQSTAVESSTIQSTSHVYAMKPAENEVRIQTIQVGSTELPVKDPAPRIIVEEEQLPVNGSHADNFEEIKTPAETPGEEKKSEVNELYIVHSQRKAEEPKTDDAGKAKEQPVENRRTETALPERKFSDRFRAVEEKRLDVKEMFPSRPRRRKDLVDTLMFGFLAIALLVTGFLIGAYYGGDKDKPIILPAPNSAQQQSATAESTTKQSNPADPSQLNTTAVVPETPKPVAKQPKKEKKIEEPVVVAAEPTVKKDNIAEEQKLKDATEKEQAKAAARASIYQDIKLKANDYRKIFLGGISDVKITLNNNSKFSLDEVVVEVTYLKNNMDVFKAETLRFQNLLPGAEATLVAPDSKRGNKIEYRILQVKSKDLGL